MTVAELHGKLSASGSNVHDRLEDLLTRTSLAMPGICLACCPSGILSDPHGG